MANIKEYHESIGFPKKIQVILDKAKKINHRMPLTFSHHAVQQSQYRGGFDLPQVIFFTDCFVFEVGTEDGIWNKIVLRAPYDEDRDIVLIIGAKDNHVWTTWLNKKKDHHPSINMSKYSYPD